MPDPQLVLAPLDEKIGADWSGCATLADNANAHINILLANGAYIEVMSASAKFAAAGYGGARCLHHYRTLSGSKATLKTPKVQGNWANGKGHEGSASRLYWDTTTASEHPTSNFDATDDPWYDRTAMTSDAPRYRPNHVLHGELTHKDDLPVVFFGGKLAIDAAAGITTGLCILFEVHGSVGTEDPAGWTSMSNGNGSQPIQFAVPNIADKTADGWQLRLTARCQPFITLPKKKKATKLSPPWGPPYVDEYEIATNYTMPWRFDENDYINFQIAARYDHRGEGDGGGGFCKAYIWKDGQTKPTTPNVDYEGPMGQPDSQAGNWPDEKIYFPGSKAGEIQRWMVRLRRAIIQGSQTDPFVEANDLEAGFALVDPTVEDVLSGGGSTQTYEQEVGGVALNGATFFLSDSVAKDIAPDTETDMTAVTWAAIDGSLSNPARTDTTTPFTFPSAFTPSALSAGNHTSRMRATRSDGSLVVHTANFQVVDDVTSATSALLDDFSTGSGSVAGRAATSATDARNIVLDTTMLGNDHPSATASVCRFTAAGQMYAFHVHDGVPKVGSLRLTWNPGGAAENGRPSAMLHFGTAPKINDINMNDVEGHGTLVTARLDRGATGDSLVQFVGIDSGDDESTGDWLFEGVSDQDLAASTNLSATHQMTVAFDLTTGQETINVKLERITTASSTVISQYFGPDYGDLVWGGPVFGVVAKKVTTSWDMFDVELSVSEYF